MILHRDDDGVFAAILSDGLKEVVDELRAIDPVDLVSYIRFGSLAAIDDLLQSSTELFFQEGTLTFGWRAGTDVRWGDLPTVTLGMEFTHRSVSVFFNLSLGTLDSMVEVCGILFDPDCRDPNERIARLSEAITDAHVVRVLPGSLPGSLPRPGGGRPFAG